MSAQTMDRRVFVKAGGLALVSFGLDPVFLARAAYAVRRGHGPADRKKVLVCIFQRGAVDGLSMVVPHGDPLYYRDRGVIAIPPPGKSGGVIDLDGYFGLHPGLETLHDLYRDGSLALIHAIGSPENNRSHFDAQDYMESGTPGVKSTRDGWLNRYLRHTSDHRETPFRGVAMSSQLPRALRGASPALAIPDLRTFGIRAAGRAKDRVTRAFEELYQGSASGLVASSSQEAFEAIRMLATVNPTGMTPTNGASYPRTPFGRSMEQIAQLVKSDLGLEIAFADVGGWDTHMNQGATEGQLGIRLRNFAQSLAAFVQDLGPRMADVLVLTMSEFGRTVRENGNQGTDHGRATAMMVIGANTNGGKVLGRWPTLDEDKREDGRDLAVTTDFRDLFGEILVGHLGDSDLTTVFPGHGTDPQRWPGALRT